MAEATKLFSKSLTETDTRKRLAIPAKILPDLPGFDASHAVNLNLLYGTKTWPIVCSVRKHGYKKPVFSGGWRNFVVCNNFCVGDELTLFKVRDEAGSCYYKVEVVKPTKPCRDLSPRAVSCLKKIPDFEYEQEQADAPKKEERAVMELAYGADEIVQVPVVGHVSSIKPPCWLFGTNLSEPTARLKSEMKFSGIVMCVVEPRLDPCNNMTKEEKEVKFLAPAESGAMAYGTIQACIESHALGFLGQATKFAGEMNLDLTLAPLTGRISHADRRSEDKSPSFFFCV